MDLKKIGYWHSDHEPTLPKPQDFVDAAWDPAERTLVISYLKGGELNNSYRGMSSCRFCEKWNGSQDLTDGVYLWPSGLAHYLEAHDVRLPEEFVQHVKRSKP